MGRSTATWCHWGAPTGSSSATSALLRRSKQLLRRHCALETATLETLRTRNSCSRAPERSKLAFRSHWALETATGYWKQLLQSHWALEYGSGHLNNLLRIHCALETAAPQPLSGPGTCDARYDSLLPPR